MTKTKFFLAIAILSLLAVGCGTSVTDEPPAPTNKGNLVKETPADSQTGPIQNSIHNWEVYRNEQSGYEINYPPDWFVEECGLNDVIIGNNQIGSYHCGDAGPSLEGGSIIDTEGVIAIRLTEFADIGTAVKAYMENFENVSQESITVAGIPAVQLQGIARQSVLGNDPQETIVCISHNAKIFVLMNDVQNNAYKETFYSVVSTLKFTR